MRVLVLLAALLPGAAAARHLLQGGVGSTGTTASGGIPFGAYAGSFMSQARRAAALACAGARR
jgi:hypothetical protein